MDPDLALLHQKIDYLTEQVELQRKKQNEFDELKADLIPIGNQLIKLTIDELAEIGQEFQVEDLLFLLKRLLRNTHTLLSLMDKMESALGMLDEANLLGKQVFSRGVTELDRLERAGYFTFAQEGWKIVERIVGEFDSEDVRALGDNIVTILNTVRSMTQPEIMALANRSIEALHEQDSNGHPPSTLNLLRQLNDPQVRMGLSRTLKIVKALSGDSPSTYEKNSKENQE